MKHYLKIVLICFLFIACKGNKVLMQKSICVLEKVHMNQLAYYNNMDKKSDYASIINFGKQGRNILAKEAVDVVGPGHFTILEGFNPAWGDYVGLIWNDRLAYSYHRQAGKKKLHISKFSISNTDLENTNVNIPSHIVEKVKNWETQYIGNLKNRVGMGISDGFYFMATRVDMDGADNNQIETISFEEFGVE
ncbi:hypothetical protein [Sphingobacterium siyangense]|jgi:hypothetical protein|uniref:Uncharacterized protein n=1 Tax=Sphingobacterium siyangense TaxID=459529 RepID=A0A562M215_9SPHI|nr:hypothetical protein [Sphingobacterium siyangense]TWI13910.1 hypothetical protein IQ31_05459 [Sphingobacterium siyangense]